MPMPEIRMGVPRQTQYLLSYRFSPEINLNPFSF